MKKNNMSLEMEFLEKPDFLEIKLSGDMDIYNSEITKEKIIEEYKLVKKDIKFTMDELKYIDSTGLGAIIGIYNHIKDDEKNIIITGLNDNIKKLFLITDLDKIFTIEED